MRQHGQFNIIYTDGMQSKSKAEWNGAYSVRMCEKHGRTNGPTAERKRRKEENDIFILVRGEFHSRLGARSTWGSTLARCVYERDEEIGRLGRWAAKRRALQSGRAHLSRWPRSVHALVQ